MASNTTIVNADEYWDALRLYPREVVSYVLQTSPQTLAQMPTPDELVARCRALLRQGGIDGEPSGANLDDMLRDLLAELRTREARGETTKALLAKKRALTNLKRSLRLTIGD